MKNAFLTILLIAPIFGLIGTMIVNNKMSFFSDALGHCALTGVAIGTLLGAKDFILIIIGFAIFFAFLVSSVIELDNASEDTIISVFSSAGLAFGMIILSFKSDFSKYSSFLIGDLLSVKTREIKLILIIFFTILIIWILCFNKLMLSSLNRDIAQSKQISYKFYKNLFVIMIALVVSASINLVGVLMVNSLLTIPAASARNISKNLKSYHFFSVLFSLFSGILGLIVSFYIGISAGATIVVFASIIFFVTLIFRVFY